MNSVLHNNLAQRPLGTQSSHTLISLWDMIQFPAWPVASVLTDLDWLKQSFSFSFHPRDPADQKTWPKYAKHFTGTAEKVEGIAQELELIETLGRCQRFLKIIAGSVAEFPLKILTAPEIVSEIEGIEGSLTKELSNLKFVHIPRSKEPYCEQSALFGEAVNKTFPLATQDIKDAGNCLAADLNTAAVFHLMRAAEQAMRALARRLKVRLPKNTIDSAGWTEIIKNIEIATAARWKKLPQGKKARKKATDFLKSCEVATDELNVLKEIWRNNVMHASSAYRASEALGVFERVRDFMQRLAKRIPIE
ncbi:MAG TPA: hypothetical protein VKS19_08755 [Verrucomicrobiae bacterium]|nr:hypothetical protein [Verrucomicrobiae bacterium]